VALVADRDPDTRWFGNQNGAIWLAAAFPRAYEVARVELQLAERSLMDYPRELRIEAIDGSGRTATLFAGAPYPELLAGILRDQRYPSLVIALPHNAAATLRISAVADVPGRWWSVHELRMWRRSSES
jgi:hypothetical protein